MSCGPAVGVASDLITKVATTYIVATATEQHGPMAPSIVIGMPMLNHRKNSKTWSGGKGGEVRARNTLVKRTESIRKLHTDYYKSMLLYYQYHGVLVKIS